MANTHAADLEKDSSQYLNRADESLLDITGNLTIELWVNLESAPGADATFGLVSKWETTGDQRSYDLSYRDESGVKKIAFFLSTGGTDATTTEWRVTQTLNTATWYHLAVVYTASTGTAEMFLNGTSIGTNATFGTSIFNSNQTLEIGRRLGGSYYDGLMDTIRLWSTTRTGTQLKESANVELGATSGLVAEWLLNNALTDNSGNSLTLTNNNTVTFVTTPLPPVTIFPPAGSMVMSGPTAQIKVSQTVAIPVASLTLSGPTPSVTVAERFVRNLTKSGAGTWVTLDKS
jgi:hypothetical protein